MFFSERMFLTGSGHTDASRKILSFYQEKHDVGVLTMCLPEFGGVGDSLRMSARCDPGTERFRCRGGSIRQPG